MVAGNSSTSFKLSFCFLRFRLEASSFDRPLDPDLVESASPACDFGLSDVESIEERPLLRLELPAVSKPAGVVFDRSDLARGRGASEVAGSGGSGSTGTSIARVRLSERKGSS
jgi:hypothetical protein